MEKKPNDKQLVDKLERYCAYQERCRQEVKLKLRQLGEADEAAQQRIVAQLERNNFLDEKRFARAFALDKFNLHGWGKVKIARALKEKGIAEHLTAYALDEINPRAYEQMLKKLLQKKERELRGEKDIFKKKGKLAGFLTGKGYEADMVWGLVEEE